jgi:uncharacterized membrane protein YkoI
MIKKIGTVAGASVAAFAVGATLAGGLAIANADDNSTTGSNQSGYTQGPRGMMGERGPGELVTGEAAQKAIDAALGKVPGTADHVHKTPDGTYLVMVTTTDGKRIVVTLDANFRVTDKQEMPAGGRGHGPGTPATAEETKQATDAALTKFPDATVLQVFKRDDNGFAVLLRTDAGKKKVVLLDENYAFQSIENPRKHRGPHGKRGHAMMGHDVTGPAFKKAEAAALAEVPGGTVMDVHKQGKKYYGWVKKADASVVVVVLDADFTVLDTKTMDFPRMPDQQQPTATNTSA